MEKTDLLRPEAYGALRPTVVELAETHISWVFLLTNDVFKVKKPVELGFLDFRMIEQRRSACEAEVRLNARLAPRVYRGIVPVRRGEDGRACIGGAGPVVDWAVHMVRLSEGQRADQLLARGALSYEAVDELARRIAAFHDAAGTGPEIAQFGRGSTIRQNIEENFAQTRETVGSYLRAEEAEEIVRWQTSFVRTHDALFEERIRTGRVRDGHGDLRLEHVYFESVSPTVIDCIEFNERFRFADVCADVAFLSMDLASHGRVDLAERLLARYAREVNDFDLYALVDFYESYRAYVRGKVAALIAADAAVDETTRKRAESEARRSFVLALSADRRSLLSPTVVAVGGIIGSGKSTVAEAIGAEMSAPVIDADRTRKAMVGVAATRPLHEGAWQGAYDPTFTGDVYKEVLRRAGVVLASGRPVVIDASFRSSTMRTLARELAAAHGAPFRFVECRAAPGLCQERLAERERRGSVSDGRLEIFDAFSANYQPVTEIAASEHLTLDTSRALDDSVTTLRAWLETWPAGLVR
jgi:aminoglycoside phosphotransferase family enzyme/predicted kinase